MMDQSDHDIRNRLLVARLPGMPQILIKLIGHLQADDLGMADLAALIAGDAGMTAKILTVANSSAYRRASRTASLEQSLVALGTDALKTLVISESVFQTFNSFSQSSSTDLRRFWRNSLTAAVVARDLAVRMDYPHVEEAYLGGLLHNVGRLALLAAAPQEYAFNFNADDDDALCAAEQRTLHITHAEAGAWLIERWHLDSFLADAVLYHHETNARLEASHPLIRIVRLAHLMASHPQDDAARADAARLCGLALEQVDAIGAASARQVEQAATQLGIDLAGTDAVAPPPVLPALQMPAPAPLDPVRQRLADEMRNLVLVAQVGQSFARQQGESGLLESMTRSARMLFDFDSTVILLENPGGAALIGMPDASAACHAEFSLPLVRGGVVADAALERRLAFIGRDAQPLGVAEQQLFRLLGSDALVCMPLLTAGRCLGLMIGGMAAWKLASCQQRAGFMTAFAAQAAGALEAALSERGLARRQLADVAEQYREASRQVVHEVNNPLAIIKNYLSVLDDKLARREPVIGEMAILNEELDRVGQLISGLAELPAGVPANAANAANAVSISATDAMRVVDEVLRLFRATGFASPEVQIVVSKHADAASVDADAATLKQILINLLKNAIEALGQSGRIEIAHRGHVHRNGALYVELAISDNGPGLAPEALAGLFSAGRSSKAGAHRGLGLSIVQGLVNKLGGMITCRSGSGGTTFEILLPASASFGVIAGARLPALDAV